MKLNNHAMIIGIGIDLVDVQRIEASLDRFGNRFAERIFTADEQAYCQSKANPATHYAARFAAKEACAKALGTGVSGGLSFLDIEITRQPNGRPGISLTGKALEASKSLKVIAIHVSLSHTDANATAIIILEN